jgi:hypothetical protein
MKKAIVLLLALVVVGALAFAEDAPPATYEFSANATGGWTTNVTAGTSTFINDWDLSLKFHLLNNLTKTTAGEGTYGSIEVTHLNLNLIEETEGMVGSDTAAWGDGADGGTGDNLSITAKIVSGPIEVGLYGAPGTNYENAKYVPLFSKDAGYTNDSGFKPSLDGAKGLTLKYSFGDMGSITLKAASSAAVAAADAVPAQVTFKVATADVSEADAVSKGYINLSTSVPWAVGDGPLVTGSVYGEVVAAKAAVAAADPHYLVGGDLALNPVKDLLAITAGAWYDLDSKDLIFSGTLGVTAGDLSVKGALDGKMPDGGDLAFDAAANVAYALFEKKDSLNLDFYYINDKAPADADKVGAGTHRGDLGFKFVDAGGLVAPLSFTLGVFDTDMLLDPAPDPMLLSFAESISYKVSLSDTTYVKPYEALRYDLNGKGTYVNGGVEASLFANTILTADFAYGGSKDDNNYVLTGGEDSKDIVLTFKAKVSL